MSSLPEKSTTPRQAINSHCQSQVEIQHLEEEFEEEKSKLPRKLSARVKAMLKANPRLSWDEAIWKLAEAGVK